MKCTRCGFENPDYLEYCQNCTAPLGSDKPEDDNQPAWGFVKGPKWADPDFSADTVSDDDVPADFVQEAKQAVYTAADKVDDAVGAAAAAVEDTVKPGRRERRIYDESYLDDYGDELDDLDDEFDDFDDARRDAKRGVGAGLVSKLKSQRKPKPTARVSYVDDEDEDDYDDYDDEPVRKPARNKSPRNLTPIITIVGILAALAVLAAGIWLIVKSAKGCNPGKKDYAAPVVEAGDEGYNFYYVTINAPEGTKLVYETTDGGRTPYTVPESCIAKFKVPVSGLLPGNPIDGDTYYATPRVLIVDDEGNESPIKIDPIAIPVPSVGLTLDNTEITTDDGKAVVSGRVNYVNAAVTVMGEPVEVAEDGTFSKEFTYDDVGHHDVEVIAQLANYQIEKQTVGITVNAPVVLDPDAVIQMPWDYGDNTFSQRIVNALTSIDVRGKVPEGSTVTAKCDSANASLTSPTVDPDGTFHFTLTMQYPGDYTVTVGCTTADGKDYERDVHLQRQPDYAPYISGALAPDYSAFSYGYSQQYKIAGTVRSIEHEGDYYLAKFELTDGHTIMIEYHNHYGSAGTIEVGRSYNSIYGRSKGFDDNGNILFYVWFIND